MRFPGFIGPSYTLVSRNADCQRTVNLYPEINELGTGKEREVAALVGTPGLSLLLTLPTGPVRATYTASDGTLYAVGGAKLYSISSDWVETELGTLNSGTGPVSFADNGNQVILVDGDYGYVYTVDIASFAQITDPDFLGADQVTYLDGYFIFNKPDSQQFYFSGLNDVSFDALDLASAEGAPDNLVGLISDHQNLFLFGEQSTEVFYDSGDADNPFQRTQGAIIEVGCAATHSIGKIQSTIFWLGKDENGRGIVYRAQGFQPKRISTHAIERVIEGLGDISLARAYTYQQAGHGFYCLVLPGAKTTWVFDMATELWHERAYLSLGQFERHRADCHAFAYSTNVVGDYANGNLYELAPDVYTDSGAAIARERVAPHLSKNGKRMFYTSLQLDMETGVGITGPGQGTEPQAMLQFSDDGGHTWSSERWAAIGALGSRLTRVIWRRLGASRDRIYRVRITDPVKVVLLGAEIEAEEGAA